MRKTLMVLAALVLVLAMSVGSASAVSAAPTPPGTITITITDYSYYGAGNSSNHFHYRVISSDNTASWGVYVYAVQDYGTYVQVRWEGTNMFSEGRLLGPWYIDQVAGGLTGPGSYFLVAKLIKKNGDVIKKGGTTLYIDSSQTITIS